MTELHHQSATLLAGGIRSGHIGARELLEHFLQRVDRHNGAINAVVVQDRAAARGQADAADRAVAQGEELGPLHGVPMTIKESFDWTGHAATWGAPAQRGNVATHDALAVQRLSAAGAIVFGKTNVPLMLADFQSYNEVYGTTHNPWDSTRTPGGSSGGSAAALAAGLTGLELGSDIGGSIRNPAHYCGVFGHKPTWNLLPMRGHALGGLLTPTDISVIGPLARSAHDLETALNVLAGPDLLESAGLALQLKGLPAKGSADDRALRIAVWSSDTLSPVSRAVAERVNAVARALAAEGATIDDKARPEFSAEHSHQLFMGLLTSAMSGRLPDAEFARVLAKADGLDPADSSPGAMQIRWQTLRARDWARLNEQRTRLRWGWQRFFERFDFLLAPIMPTSAFAHDQADPALRSISVDGVAYPYFSQTFWAGLAGLGQLPATVVPTGPDADGLPIGVQIIGPAYGDLRCIHLAQRLEAMGFAFTPPPGWA